MLRTQEDWNKSKLNFTLWAEIGDEVDDEIYDHFLGCVPPAVSTPTHMQCGEPYDHNSKGTTFISFQKVNGKWTYAGILNRYSKAVLSASKA